MTDVKKRAAAARFAKQWSNRGYEKGESQIFWVTLLTDVFDVKDVDSFITFEEQVKLDNTSFIDGHIRSTHVLIEQKSFGKNLNAPIRQSDGRLLTPFQQAKRYSAELPYSERPRWIVTCNFQEFYIYDMEQPHGDPQIVRLEDLEKDYYRLNFLVDTGDENIRREMEVSLKAGELVGVIYDALLKKYNDPTAPETLKSLNALCVRLVFCLYAEDAGIFGRRNLFHDYLQAHRTEDRRALINLFRILDQTPEQRDPYLDEDIAAFPYVNGGLFADENIEIPRLGEEIIDLILKRASADFDWSAISPTIFGAVFESTLNPETRRSGGMHYTSIENIHKVIDPLFLDALRAELAEIKEIAVERTRDRRLRDYQKKLASLKFLDPACGSGNFLTETYLSLRRLENEVIGLLNRNQIVMEINDPIHVSISQFYGIEINDFAVTVAKTALWIAESQMMKETEDVVHMSLDFLPLKTNANITEGNALRIDWASVTPKHELNYIMGNPPFVGYTYQTGFQKADLQALSSGMGKNIDYVAGWFFKAAQYMQGTALRAAFVSTNSITQGEQVFGVWKPLFDNFKIHIDFAHQTFRWDSEAALKAHVHCVIVGFSIAPNPSAKRLYSSDRVQNAGIINAYLLDAPIVFIEKRARPLCPVPEMCKGSQPTDGGNLILSQEEKEALLAESPEAEPYIRSFVGAEEYINNKKRYCLWLVNASPVFIKNCKPVRQRVERVREMRLASSKAATRQWAEKPTLFTENRHSEKPYIIVPSVSSEQRRYVPIGFLSPDTVASNLVLIIPDATLYHFGVLTSCVHMEWMRAVCGRLEMRYRYSNTIVYNNFPWPTPTDAQKEKIRKTAQAILDARALYPDCSLADLYDDVAMPPELRKAHQENDKAVMRAYGFDIKSTKETGCVAELMRMYQGLIRNREKDATL